MSVQIVPCDRSGRRYLQYPIEDIVRVYGGWDKEARTSLIAIETAIGTIERHTGISIQEAVSELSALGCTVTKRPLSDRTYEIGMEATP